MSIIVLTHHKLAYAFEDMSVPSFLGAYGLMFMIRAIEHIKLMVATSGRGDITAVDDIRLRT